MYSNYYYKNYVHTNVDEDEVWSEVNFKDGLNFHLVPPSGQMLICPLLKFMFSINANYQKLYT